MTATKRPCPVCGLSPAQERFETVVRARYRAVYCGCDRCGFLFADKPTWLHEAYEDPITVSDTGLLARSHRFSGYTAILCYFLVDRQGTFLDYGGGYGVFTRLMRDMGFDFYWWDPHCSNLFARGFEHPPGRKGYELVTCLEVLEHVTDPVGELRRILDLSDRVLVSTTLFPSPIPQPGSWAYYGLEHGQHIAFFCRRTFQVMADRLGCHVYPWTPRLFLFTRQPMGGWRMPLLRRLNHKVLVTHVRRHMQSRTEQDSQAVIAGSGRA